MSIYKSDGAARAEYRQKSLSRHEIVAMAVVMIAGTAGLTWLSIHVTHPGRVVAGEDRPGTNDTVAREVIAVFIPQEFAELARNAGEFQEGVTARLQPLGLEKAWYGIIYRERLAGGKFLITPYGCRPLVTTWKAWEFPAVLAIARGNPPHYGAADFSVAGVWLIPPDLAKAEPHEAIRELVRRWERGELQSGRQG